MLTKTLAALSMHLTCRIRTVFCTLWIVANLALHHHGGRPPCQCTAPVGTQRSSEFVWIVWISTTRASTTLSIHCKHLCGFLRRLHLHCEHPLQRTTSMSTTPALNCVRGNPAVHLDWWNFSPLDHWSQPSLRCAAPDTHSAPRFVSDRARVVGPAQLQRKPFDQGMACYLAQIPRAVAVPFSCPLAKHPLSW